MSSSQFADAEDDQFADADDSDVEDVTTLYASAGLRPNVLVTGGVASPSLLMRDDSTRVAAALGHGVGVTSSSSSNAWKTKVNPFNNPYLMANTGGMGVPLRTHPTVVPFYQKGPIGTGTVPVQRRPPPMHHLVTHASPKKRDYNSSKAGRKAVKKKAVASSKKKGTATMSVQRQPPPMHHLMTHASPKKRDYDSISKAGHRVVQKTGGKSSSSDQKKVPPAKKTKKKKTSNVFTCRETTVVPDSLVRQQVARATSLVAQEIRSGVWPHRNNEQQLQQAACAIEKFSNDIVLPSLQQSVGAKKAPAFVEYQKRGVGKRYLQQQEEEEERPFFATLIMLREVLMQNMDTLLGNVDQNDNLDDNALPSATQHREEEAAFRTHLLATAIVLAAVDRLKRPALVLELTDLLEKYDTGHRDFAAALEPADGRCRNVVPSGRALDREEEVACRVSFNCARKTHPLLQKTTRRHALTEDGPHNQAERKDENIPRQSLHRFAVTQPNACHVSIVEREP